MKRINTLAELKAEQKVLRLRKTYLEAEMKKDFEGIKEDLAPLKLLTSNNNSLLGTSAGMAADFITSNTLVKNSGMLMKLIVPFLVKNATSNIVENNKSKVVGWVEGIISKFTHKHTADENA